MKLIDYFRIKRAIKVEISQVNDTADKTHKPPQYPEKPKTSVNTKSPQVNRADRPEKKTLLITVVRDAPAHKVEKQPKERRSRNTENELDLSIIDFYFSKGGHTRNFSPSELSVHFKISRRDAYRRLERLGLYVKESPQQQAVATEAAEIWNKQYSNLLDLIESGGVISRHDFISELENAGIRVFFGTKHLRFWNDQTDRGSGMAPKGDIGQAEMRTILKQLGVR